MRKDFMFITGIISLCFIGCGLAWLSMPEPIPVPTPTPQFVTLPPPIALVALIETDREFHYLPFYYIPDDTTVWLMFGWPDEDLLYKAVFGVENGKWILLDVEKVGDETSYKGIKQSYY